jgi:subtilisin family serine protease
MFRVGLRLTATAALAVVAFACVDGPADVPEVDGPAFAKASAEGGNSYLLSAGKWRRTQTRAVQRAGGTVTFIHKASGIGFVTSDDPDFLDRVMATDRFSAGTQDATVEWGLPTVPEEMAGEEPSAGQAGNGIQPDDDTHFQKQWNMQAINAPQAWADGYDGTGARVAVLDGGVNDTHGDLAGQVDAACSASFYPPYPFNFDTGFLWHGSHVAGIVAAADNSFGTVGVAPGATIMAVKAMHDGEGPFSAIIGGILFASDPTAFGPQYADCQRADIINMSFSTAFFKSSFPGFHSIVTRVVNFAASKGVLVISAAANNGLDFGQLRDAIVIPAQSGSGLAISATGPLGWQALGSMDFRRFASYSNWGEDLVDLAGPGGDFAYPGDELCTFDGTTFPCWVFDMVPAPCGGGGGNFTCWTVGTSMAAPAAAGVAALIVGANPGIPLGKLKAMLKNSADDEGKNGKDEFYGHGFVNAHKAVMQ